MVITACGVNHKTAPLALRERLAIVPDEIQAPLHDLVSNTDVKEAAVLSTCNRFELYCTLEQQQSVIDWICARQNIAPSQFRKHLYVYQNADAVKHMLRVASGLDSMVLGEPQILGQMKDAFHNAVQAGTVGPQLQHLFQYVFAVTKEVRSKTAIGANAISIAYAAVSLAKHIFANIKETTVLVVGAGETIHLTLSYLTRAKVKKIYLANRNLENAESLKAKYAVELISMADIPFYLSSADIVISATSAPLPIIGKGMVERCIKQRKHKPMLMVDLAVPRDIEPEVGDLSDVYLYCIDDLQQVIENNRNDRLAAAEQAEAIIACQVERYMQWHQALDVSKTIQDFRSQLEAKADVEVEKALQALVRGQSPELVVRHATRALINQILHTPTIRLRKAGIEQDAEIVASARKLFALDSDE